MNQHPGVIGRKLGMTQVFDEDGTVTACTVVEAANVVVAKRTVEKDGYSAIVLSTMPMLPVSCSRKASSWTCKA